MELICWILTPATHWHIPLSPPLISLVLYSIVQVQATSNKNLHTTVNTWEAWHFSDVTATVIILEACLVTVAHICP